MSVDSMWTRRRAAGVKRWIMCTVSYLAMPRRMCIVIPLTLHGLRQWSAESVMCYMHSADGTLYSCTGYITSRCTGDALPISKAYVLRPQSSSRVQIASYGALIGACSRHEAMRGKGTRA
ncbi:hypothetical protein FIBSPDRAFT_876924 [Athelia psychrophila]|uniref:Uncharacterized protein n=1 Tax=Athelia psychrophila TaxID=1759441 RepID=A0A167WEH9_9AGAM|nr:hypothetical protein FIBSPDRAFT_876924 [Fibularhizoctonia sp. CBS 109695]